MTDLNISKTRMLHVSTVINNFPPPKFLSDAYIRKHETQIKQGIMEAELKKFDPKIHQKKYQKPLAQKKIQLHVEEKPKTPFLTKFGKQLLRDYAEF